MTNLLTNAAKYTPPGGAIEIGVAAAGDRARITVRDNGNGLSADRLPRILPVMDGYKLAAALRERVGPALCMMAVTGYGQAHDRVRTSRAGFDAHFVKPVGLGKILAAIELAK